MIVHDDPDDLMTDPAGNSGGHVVCAVFAAPQATAATPAASPTVTEPPAVVTSPATDTGAGATVALTAIDINWVEKKLSIAADSDTRFMVTNQGASGHNFSIDELGVSVDIAPVDAAEVTVNVPAGAYQYY